jgi:shikimate dehydrogenase
MTMRITQPLALPAVPIGGHTRLVGLIGWPVEHSVSPPMHNAAFQACGMDWCYLPFPVPPDKVREAVLGARALGLRGINVTVPHKQAAHDLADRLTPAARAIGAVNTLILEPDEIVGHNTDAGGFLRDLQEHGVQPQGISALILGAGGAAHAVVYALISEGAQITILNRTLSRAQALVAEFTPLVTGKPLMASELNPFTLARHADGVQLVVNTTPIGMWPHVDASPWPAEVPFPSEAFCYDLVYNPRETRLMHQARQAGAQAAHGLGMLVYQGAEAFRYWTGIEPPADVMLATCVAALGGG